jgi:hypothetical protein
MKLGERKKEKKKQNPSKEFVAAYWKLSLKIWRLGI